MKDILEPVQDYPVVLPELMELADWMHERYLCNLVDALRLMIPAPMRGDRVHVRTRREDPAGCRFAIPSQDGGRRRVPWRL